MAAFGQPIFFEENFVLSEDDSEDTKKYKVLLNIEYSFCIKIIDSVIRNASKLYDEQMSTGKIVRFCCDFRLLEEKSKEYPVK